MKVRVRLQHIAKARAGWMQRLLRKREQGPKLDEWCVLYSPRQDYQPLQAFRPREVKASWIIRSDGRKKFSLIGR
jgi:hypothetical protein